VAKRAPQNLDEADKFADSGKPAQMKQDLQGRVGDGKKDAAADIASTTAAPPDTSNAVTKQVTPLSPDRPPPTPAPPDPGQAVPDKLPAAATDLSGGPKRMDQEMATAHVTDAQLARSNEPQFTAALKGKQAAQTESAAGQARMRGHENATLASAKNDAHRVAATGMQQIGGARVAAGAKVSSGKSGYKTSDEAKRAQVTATLQRVFDAKKTDVEDILSGLDGKG